MATGSELRIQGSLGAALFLVAGVLAGVLAVSCQHVVHHCGQFVRQDLVGGRGGVDWILTPQLNDGVSVHIIIVEAEGMVGIEHFHSLDPPHEDRVVDPGIDIPDGLDHLLNVVLNVAVGKMPWVITAPGKEVSGHGPHDNDSLNP